MSEQRITMNFSEEWQEAIIGHALRDQTFFLKFREHLSPTWFSKGGYSDIMIGTVKFFEKFNRLPNNANEFVEHHFKNSMGLSLTDVDKYSALVARCAMSSKKYGLDVVVQDLTAWAKMAKLKGSLEAIEQFWSKKKYHDGADFLRGKMVEILGTNFDKDARLSFSDTWEFFKDMARDSEGSCTIGHPHFDELLDPRAKWSSDYTSLEVGSLHRGDLTVFMGPSNSGKTSALVTIAAANIKMKKRIIYFTHEQKDKDIRKKVIQSITGISLNDINDWMRLANKDGTMSTEAQRSDIGQQILAAEVILEEYLVYIPYSKAGEMHVENVINEIKLQQEKLIATKGKGFDMLIEDYPAKLQSKAFNTRKADSRIEMEYVYDQFQILAKELNLHSLVAAQTNREGFKMSNKQNSSGEKRLLDQGDIAESFGVVRIADNVITINRGTEEIKNGTVIFNISKSRSNSTGHQFKSLTKMDRSMTHSPSLECSVLKNGQNIADTIPVLKRELMWSKETVKPSSYEALASITPTKTTSEIADEIMAREMDLSVGVSGEDMTDYFEGDEE
jgi:KaiC/GvpD/RAD55 family RecA-like ATPase